MTNAIVEVRNHFEVVANILVNADGYPSHLGKQLEEFAKSVEIVNGLPVAARAGIANGMGDFAAQLVCFLKEGPGNIYLISQQQADEGFPNYHYIITGNVGQPVTVTL